MRKQRKRLLCGMLSVTMAFSLVAVSPGTGGKVVHAEETEAADNLFQNDSAGNWTLSPAVGTTITYDAGTLKLTQGASGADITLTQNIEREEDATYTCSVKATTTTSNIWIKPYVGESWNSPSTEVDTSEGTSFSFTVPKGQADEIGWSIWIEANTELILSDMSLTKDSAPDVEPAEALQDIVDTCQSLNLNKDEYTEKSWAKYEAALNAAKATLNDVENKTDDEITAQVRALKQAKNSLKETIFVKKVNNLSQDFIRGVDISSYVSIKDSGATFKDEDGNVLSDAEFFTLLKNSGINYVRIKIWNDPYTYVDANNKEYSVDDVQGSGENLYVEKDGNQIPVTRCGYGGGNNDLEKAIIIGKLAADAGMKSLIDFHYSDFWADPSRQHAPKAWEGMTLAEKTTALHDYTKESLETLIKEGVDVGMVQVGNETNNGIAGAEGWPDMCKLFKAGCEAVKEVSQGISQGIMTAVHFTDPQTPNEYNKIAKRLDENGVDYDVFASSYYPNIHGTMENITNVLNEVAKTYHKKVMVAETAWAWTDTKDGDGHGNTFSAPADSDYPVSVQGQANVIRDVVQAVVNIEDNAGIGVFYWEPAWIPAEYAYDEDGELIDSVKTSNKEKWETYGSGWASSYAGLSYDTDAVGEWYGGSVKDNEAFFDFNGEPLSSLTVFKDIYNGVSGKVVKLDLVKQPNIELTLNDISSNLEAIRTELPATVVGIYNDSSRKDLAVQWNTQELESITDFGTHKITGTASYQDASGSPATVDATCSLTIMPDSILPNGDFENGNEGWTVTNPSNTDLKWDDTPMRGKGTLHFWNGSKVEFSVEQTVTAPKSGTYIASVYLQGSDGNNEEDIKITVTNKTQQIESEGGTVKFAGWNNWQKGMTTAVAAKKGDELTVRISFNAPAGAWGSIDDVFLYAKSLEKEVLATSVQLDVTEKTLAVGDTVTLHATVAPTNADPGVTWSTSDANVATVSADGVVMAVAAGNATISATTKDGSNKTATCSITVTAKTNDPAGNNPTGNNPTGNNPASSLPAQTITCKSSYTKTYGDKAFNLNATAEGALTYTSSKKTVATVDQTGKVTIKGAGVTVITITAAATDKYAAASMDVTITVKPKKLSGVTAKAASKKITVKWKKDASAAGYQVEYSTSKKFKAAKTKTTGKTSITIKGLTKKKTYYVRVCAYAKDGTKKVLGAYSKTVTVKVK